jgi:tetratricopeptide repeat protein
MLNCTNVKAWKSARPYFLRTGHYIFAIVFLLRIIVLAQLTVSPFLLPMRGDMHFYDDWAQRILHGQLTDHLAFYGLPLYAYLLALLYRVFGYNPFLPGLLQAGFDAGTAVILYQLGVRVFSQPSPEQQTKEKAPFLDFVLRKRGQLVGVTAALGWAIFVPAQAYAAILMPAVWLVFVFWLLVWRIARNSNAPTGKECLSLGLLIGITAMGIATILILVPLVLAALLVKPNRDQQRRRRSLAFATALLFAGIAVGSSPCWIHNYFIARDAVFLSAHSGVNFWIGNNPQATGYPRFPPGLHAGQEVMLKDSINVAEKAAGYPLKRSQISAYWSGKAKDYIRHHFYEWLRLLSTKAKNFWNAFQYDDLSMITALREYHVLLPGLRFGIVAALAIPGLLIACRQFPLSRWILAAILLQILALLPVFITERYRLVAVPGLLIFAAFGLSIFWQACATMQLRLAAVYLALLVGSTIFVAWPVREPSLWALDAYNSGWQALESNDLVLAEKKLQLAYAYVPDNAETNFALGNLRLAQGNKSAAKSYYLATLRLDPTHEGSYNNLGIVALQEERWNLAAQFFTKAVQQDPRDAKTYYLIAQAHFKAGDFRNASLAITQAIKLNPTQPQFHALSEEIQRALTGESQR